MPAPAAPPPSADVVLTGPPVPAIKRLEILSPEEWEEFVLEWADSLRDRYESVERHGGAQDLGCDVVAYIRDSDGSWDNYQCKRYAKRLTPSDIWVEIGKLIYHTHRGAMTVPRKYVFAASKGAGTKLANLLRNPDELRQGLIDAWDGKCRTEIASEAIELAGDLAEYVNQFDFTIFSAVPPLTLLDQHAQTRWHIARFGSGLPQRPTVPVPPEAPADVESVYVQALMEAYGDHLGAAIGGVDDLDTRPDLVEHFDDSRIAFYSAEGLRVFSRDTLPPGSFEAFQGDVHAGIKNDLRHPHADGYARVIAATATAQSLALTAHALHGTATIPDRHGLCHQLANDGKVSWKV